MLVKQIIEEFCKLFAEDVCEAFTYEKLRGGFNYEEELADYYVPPESFVERFAISKLSPPLNEVQQLSQQLSQLRLVCRAFDHPALIHMTSYAPLAFDKPGR